MNISNQLLDEIANECQPLFKGIKQEDIAFGEDTSKSGNFGGFTGTEFEKTDGTEQSESADK